MITFITPPRQAVPQRRRTAVAVALLVVLFLAVRAAVPTFSPPEIVYEQSPEVGDEVIVRFQRSVEERDARARFRIEPETEGELVWLGEFRELHFVPKEGFRPGTTYTVTVVPASRLLAALPGPMQAFVFTPGRAVLDASLLQPIAPVGKSIDVNLSTMTLTLLEDGKPVKTYPVAGKGSPWTFPTREGTFSILSKEENHLSSIYRVWMPLAMRYSGNYYIHAWPYWPGGRRLTSTYSGGCLRLDDEDAAAVYAWTDVGTPVRVHSTPGQVPLFSADAIEDGDLVREVSEAEVYVVKRASTGLYKRHVLTTKFADWYPHFAPFWLRVKTVPDGALDAYAVSRWVKAPVASDSEGHRYIYEIRAPGMKHVMYCGMTPGNAAVGPQYCEAMWSAHGWDPNEVYIVSEDELSAYEEGAPILLPVAQ